MFSKLGHFAHARRRVLLITAALFAVVAGIWGSGVFGAMITGGLEPPNAESNRANELLYDHFGHQPGDLDTVAVYTDPTGELTVDDPAFQQAVTAALDRLPESEVLSWTGYWSPELTEEERAGYVSEDRSSTIVTITLQGADETERLESYAEIEDPARADGGRLETYLAGGPTSVHHLQEQAQQGLAVVWALAVIITIAFGLVTDYEMFLVSRVHEEYRNTGDNGHAIRVGLQQTGSVITRAGLLMVVVLASMGFSATSLFVMTIGIGLTLAVVIDATVVRSIIVPAAMQLLGRANWWPTRPRLDADAWRQVVAEDFLGFGDERGETLVSGAHDERE